MKPKKACHIHAWRACQLEPKQEGDAGMRKMRMAQARARPAAAACAALRTCAWCPVVWGRPYPSTSSRLCACSRCVLPAASLPSPSHMVACP